MKVSNCCGEVGELRYQYHTSTADFEQIGRCAKCGERCEYIEETGDLCDRCHKNKAEESHTCPYAEDINGDSESKCNCCPDCEHECCMDI